MNQESTVKATIEVVRNEYGLDEYSADRAIIQTPFAQKHFDEGIQRLANSKAVAKLAKNGSVLVVTITAKQTNVDRLPGWIKCIQVDRVPEWPKHPSYQNRFFKWATPFLFSNIRVSLYLDSDIIISQKQSKLLRVFEATEEKGFLVTAHSQRKGWEDEYKAILTSSRYIDHDKLQRQHKYFIKEGLPESAEVFQNKFIGRVHSSELNILCFETLKQMIEFSERDQLALAYACFKHKKKPFASKEGEFLHPFLNSRFINFKNIAFVDPVDMLSGYNPLALEGSPLLAQLWQYILKLKFFCMTRFKSKS